VGAAAAAVLLVVAIAQHAIQGMPSKHIPNKDINSKGINSQHITSPDIPNGKKVPLSPQICFKHSRHAADKTRTMDWEGGTIGAIVPALMGHGEAGRASPWPFSFLCDDSKTNNQENRHQKGQPPKHCFGGCFSLRLGKQRAGNSCPVSLRFITTERDGYDPSATLISGTMLDCGRSGEQLLNHAAVAYESDRTARVRVVFKHGIDPKVVIEAGSDIIRRDPLVSRSGSGIIAFPNDLTATNGTACHQHEHAAGVVVSAPFGAARVDLWRAAEFSGHEDCSRC
jgi:hypothetical protein